MWRSFTQIIAVACLFSFLASCKKGDKGLTGPSFTGAISGHVSIYDQYGSRVNTGLNNVQLTLKGSRSQYADTTGYFIFGNVTTGGYSIAANGAGLAATILYNVPFVSDTVYEDVRLSQVPSFNLNYINSSYVSPNTYDELIIDYPLDTRVRNCIVFASSAPNVSNNPGTYALVYIKQLAANTISTNFQVPVQDLNEAGIFYGDKVYYAAYSYVINDASVYDDAATGKTIYNAVGTAIIDSTTCP